MKTKQKENKTTTAPDRVKNTKSPSIIEQITPEITKLTPPLITDSETLSQNVELLSRLNKYADALESDKQSITAPINASLKAIRAKYKATEDKLSEMIDSIRKNMGVYHTEKTRLQQIEEQRISDRVASGRLGMTKALEKMEAIEKPEQKIITESGKLTFRTQKKFEITDPTLIPRQYLIPDETAIRNAMRANLPVAGVRYFEESVPFNSR